jgi:signal transduction histidine kinase
MNVKIRNRVSIYFTVSTSLLMIILFFLIYSVVLNTVYRHLDEDLSSEAEEVRNNIVILESGILFANYYEWLEKEHGQIEANPTYVQLVNENGLVLRKTPNLFNETVLYDSVQKGPVFFNTLLSGKKVREYQTPIFDNNKKLVGFILVAIPLAEYEVVLGNLRTVLIAAFPLMLIISFLFSKFISGRSISPVNRVIHTAEIITNENINERIELPKHKDEIYQLVNTINGLLDRLQDGLNRERQFISDASHELRTPLSVVKGNLEVLIRKPRTSGEYEDKIAYCINEVDRISVLVEQLLMLARYDKETSVPVYVETHLDDVISNVLKRLSGLIMQYDSNVSFNNSFYGKFSADANILTSIFENIVSNAVKYSGKHGKILITAKETDNFIECVISDSGPGIPEDQINKVFDRFYRSDESRASDIKGYGLGLSIVKKLSEIHKINCNITNNPRKGTDFTVRIPL